MNQSVCDPENDGAEVFLVFILCFILFVDLFRDHVDRQSTAYSQKTKGKKKNTENKKKKKKKVNRKLARYSISFDNNWTSSKTKDEFLSKHTDVSMLN